MFRITVCLLTVIVANLATDDMNTKCEELLHVKYRPCCQLDIKMKIHDVIKDCFKLPNEPGTCERDACFVTKFEAPVKEGKIDTKSIQDRIVDKLTNYPKIVEEVKSKCFDKEYSSNTCVLQKITDCTQFETLANCPALSNISACKDVDSFLKECTKKFH